jgi:uncharacterized protein (DUF488 family)
VTQGPGPTIFTIGHGTREIRAFLNLLEVAGVRRLVDVRTAPGSRKHPQFGKEALASSLAEEGIGYEWEGKAFGGWRRARADSRHTALRSPGFRGYADLMETDSFREARTRLVDSSRQVPTAVMCAESLWWRCHRRMLADSLVAAGCQVRHIMEGGRLDPHRLSRSARIEDGVPVYDVVENEASESEELARGEGTLKDSGT